VQKEGGVYAHCWEVARPRAAADGGRLARGGGGEATAGGGEAREGNSGLAAGGGEARSGGGEEKIGDGLGVVGEAGGGAFNSANGGPAGLAEEFAAGTGVVTFTISASRKPGRREAARSLSVTLNRQREVRKCKCESLGVEAG